MRICSVCKKTMREGFLNETDSNTYCSVECRCTVISKEEYEKAYEEGWFFWTSWESSRQMNFFRGDML